MSLQDTENTMSFKSKKAKRNFDKLKEEFHSAFKDFMSGAEYNNGYNKSSNKADNKSSSDEKINVNSTCKSYGEHVVPLVSNPPSNRHIDNKGSCYGDDAAMNDNNEGARHVGNDEGLCNNDDQVNTGFSHQCESHTNNCEGLTPAFPKSILKRYYSDTSPRNPARKVDFSDVGSFRIITDSEDYTSEFSDCDYYYDYYDTPNYYKAYNVSYNTPRFTNISSCSDTESDSDNSDCDPVRIPKALRKSMRTCKQFNGNPKHLRHFFIELEETFDCLISRKHRADKKQFDRLCALCLRSHLTGVALEFCSSLSSSTKRSYKKLKVALKERFSESLDSEFILRKLNAIDQGELSVLALKDKLVYYVDSYVDADEIMQLSSSSQRKDRREFLLHSHFLRALHSDIYARLVLEGKPKTFESTVKKAFKIETALRAIMAHRENSYSQGEYNRISWKNTPCSTQHMYPGNNPDYINGIHHPVPQVNVTDTSKPPPPSVNVINNGPKLPLYNIRLKNTNQSYNNGNRLPFKVDLTRPPPKIINIQYVKKPTYMSDYRKPATYYRSQNFIPNKQVIKHGESKCITSPTMGGGQVMANNKPYRVASLSLNQRLIQEESNVGDISSRQSYESNLYKTSKVPSFVVKSQPSRDCVENVHNNRGNYNNNASTNAGEMYNEANINSSCNGKHVNNMSKPVINNNNVNQLLMEFIKFNLVAKLIHPVTVAHLLFPLIINNIVTRSGKFSNWVK